MRLLKPGFCVRFSLSAIGCPGGRSYDGGLGAVAADTGKGYACWVLSEGATACEGLDPPTPKNFFSRPLSSANGGGSERGTRARTANANRPKGKYMGWTP